MPHRLAISDREHQFASLTITDFGAGIISRSEEKNKISGFTRERKKHAQNTYLTRARKFRGSYRRNEFVNEAGHSRASVRLGDSMSGASAC